MSFFRHVLCIFLLAGFMLGSHKGYLALWKESSEDPFQIFPVKVESLPPADQESLHRGIPARSELELARLLEDYLS